MNKRLRHYENSTVISAPVEEVFTYADDHKRLSSHMSQSSPMLVGNKMETYVDEGRGQTVGSHIKMSGRVFGVNLFLDEVITIHEPPHHKEWQTVGDINLLVIDHYKLGFEIKSQEEGSHFKVYIDYDLPQSLRTRLLGLLFGGMYAKWCVQQMLKRVRDHFTKMNA